MRLVQKNVDLYRKVLPTFQIVFCLVPINITYTCANIIWPVWICFSMETKTQTREQILLEQVYFFTEQ